MPMLDRLMAYLREQKDGALPKSQYGQGDRLRSEPLDELRRYTEDGRLEIDNNTSERTLRLCAIGRKNWMFLGSDRGGETAAILFQHPGQCQALSDRAVCVRASFAGRPVVGRRGPGVAACPTSGSRRTRSTSSSTVAMRPRRPRMRDVVVELCAGRRPEELSPSL